MSLFRSIATVGSFTLLSRITGFLRDMMIAAFLGAGMVADAFFVAFRFPNLFRSLFAEGAFSAAFVPLFAGKLESDGKEAARLFAEQAMAVLFWGAAFFVALMEIIMPWAIYVIAPGFAEVDGKMELAQELSRIAFPYLLFISLVSLQGGILNSYGRFAAAAGTPVLLNLVLMASLAGLTPYLPTAGHALAWGVTLAGIAQFSWLVVSVRRAGVILRPTLPRLTPEVRLLLKRVLPGAVGAGVYQVNLLVGTFIASLAPQGTISLLYYADRVNQLPLGIIGVAIGTALLPVLSRQLRAGELVAAHSSQNRALEFGLLLTLPATASLLTLSVPIVRTLFEHGSFGPAQTIGTAAALSIYALGLPAFILNKALTPSFFAREDTTTPVKLAMVSIVCNIVLSFALVAPLAHIGLALASSLSAWLNVGLLLLVLHRRKLSAWDAQLRRRVPRILLASILLGCALYGANHGLSLLGPQSTIMRILTLTGVVVAGMTLFGILAPLCGAMRWSELTALRRRRR